MSDPAACRACGAFLVGGGPHGSYQPCGCGASPLYTPPSDHEVCRYCDGDLREPGATVKHAHYLGLRTPACRWCLSRWLRVRSMVLTRGEIIAPRPEHGMTRWLAEHTNHAALLAEIGVGNPWHWTGPDRVECEASAVAFSELSAEDAWRAANECTSCGSSPCACRIDLVDAIRRGELGAGMTDAAAHELAELILRDAISLEDARALLGQHWSGCAHQWSDEWPQRCAHCEAVRGLHGGALTVGVA